MPAVNYKGKESEQSKARRAKPKKPKWRLGWGALEFAKKAVTGHQAKTKKAIDQAMK